jgi:hypothetical protein
LSKKTILCRFKLFTKERLHRKNNLKVKKVSRTEQKNNRSILKFVKPTISVLGTFGSGKEINRIYDNLAYVTLITQCWYEFV